MNSSVKGGEKNGEKETPRQQKQWSFSFLEKDRNTIDQDFRRQAAFQSSTRISALERDGRTKESSGLLEVL
jgi:hypothetical protein